MPPGFIEPSLAGTEAGRHQLMVEAGVSAGPIGIIFFGIIPLKDPRAISRLSGSHFPQISLSILGEGRGEVNKRLPDLGPVKKTIPIFFMANWNHAG